LNMDVRETVLVADRAVVLFLGDGSLAGRVICAHGAIWERWLAAGGEENLTPFAWEGETRTASRIAVVAGSVFIVFTVCCRDGATVGSRSSGVGSLAGC
jgi:hypothetical protein